MISKTMTPAETIRQVVRGERPWTDLRDLGIEVYPEQRFANQMPAIDIEASLEDLAKGFVAYLDDPVALGEWAFVMESLPTDFQVEGHPQGADVMDALWKASFCDPLPDSHVQILRRLASKDPNEA